MHGRVSGFTGVQVVARAACTVAVIPVLDLRFRAGVVVGVDRAETAAATAREAGGEAARFGHPVQVIHAREGGEQGEPVVLRIAAEAIRDACRRWACARAWSRIRPPGRCWMPPGPPHCS